VPENARFPERPLGAAARPKRPRRDASFKKRACWTLVAYRAARAAGGRPPLPRVERRARQLGCSGQSIFRWADLIAKFGERGLAPAPRREKGTSRRFKDRPLAVAFVFAKFVRGLTATAIHRELTTEWSRLYGDKVPSRNTVAGFPRSIVLARSRQVRP
jgi:hypothetical protein